MLARWPGAAFGPRRAVVRRLRTVGCTQVWCTKRATTIRMPTSANRNAVTKTKRNLSSLPSRRMGRILWLAKDHRPNRDAKDAIGTRSARNACAMELILAY